MIYLYNSCFEQKKSCSKVGVLLGIGQSMVVALGIIAILGTFGKFNDFSTPLRTGIIATTASLGGVLFSDFLIFLINPGSKKKNKEISHIATPKSIKSSKVQIIQPSIKIPCLMADGSRKHIEAKHNGKYYVLWDKEKNQAVSIDNHGSSLAINQSGKAFLYRYNAKGKKVKKAIHGPWHLIRYKDSIRVCEGGIAEKILRKKYFMINERKKIRQQFLD